MPRARLKEKVGEHYIRGKDGGMTELKPGQVMTQSDAHIKAFGDKFVVLNRRRSTKAGVPKAETSGNGGDDNSNGPDGASSDQDNGGDHQDDLKG
jgi:hypothetical protein